MTTPSRTPLRISVVESSTGAQIYLSSDELAAAAGISPAALARFIRLGVVDPPVPMVSERGLTLPLFPAAAAARLRRIGRLHRDLGVNFTGAAIIADLLERLERLEAELSTRTTESR
ncbi:MAG TPA: chaperone modulator CbpM [Candidatus Sulfotelmatobacter sp.]|nr:chaperone modulator CbpM [Candidatus Sulfotelmatobacter sp.]